MSLVDRDYFICLQRNGEKSEINHSKAPDGEFSHESGIQILARAGQISDNKQDPSKVTPARPLSLTEKCSWMLLFAALLVLKLFLEL